MQNSNGDRLMRELNTVRAQLGIVHAEVVVAAIALHHQNADHDEEIARVLEYCVGSRLYDQMEQLATLIHDDNAGEPCRPHHRSD